MPILRANGTLTHYRPTKVLASVGTIPVGDDSDATYIDVTDGSLGSTVALPALVGASDTDPVTLHVRIQVLADAGFTGTGEIFIATNAGISNNEIAGFSTGAGSGYAFNMGSEALGGIHEYSVPLRLGPWGTTLPEVIGALQAGAFLDFNAFSWHTGSTPPTFRVYDAWIQVGEEVPDGCYTIDIPADWVIENGSQPDAVVIGGTGALTSQNDDTAYIEGLINNSTPASPYFRYTFPPTELPAGYYVQNVELVAQGRRISTLLGGGTGTLTNNQGRAATFYTNHGTGVNQLGARFDGSVLNPTPQQFPTAGWGEIVVPWNENYPTLTEPSVPWEQFITEGSFASMGRYGDLYAEGSRLTYLAMRVTICPTEPSGRIYIRRPLRMHPRDDGLGMSSAPRLDANRTIQASLRRAGNTHI